MMWRSKGPTHPEIFPKKQHNIRVGVTSKVAGGESAACGRLWAVRDIGAGRDKT
jgi:hypothetical protein